MALHLPKELVEALHASGNLLEVVDPETNQVFVICDPGVHSRAKAILDREAIQRGIEQMERGEGRPLNDAFDEMQSRLGFPERQ
ncbi:MAG: hypothetical protein ACI9G1_003599 [Pirellulaceae bacterium]|jgi:hypothetical protein